MAIVWQQLKVLIWRNILLKKRSRSQVLQEMFFTIFLVFAIAISKSHSPTKSGVKPRVKFPVKDLTATNFGNPFSRSGTILVVPDTTQVKIWMDAVIAQLPGPPSVRYFDKVEDSESVFEENPENVFAGVIFNINQQLYSYAIRMKYDDLPDTNLLFDDSKAACRDEGKEKKEKKLKRLIGLKEKCIVNKYLESGFVHLQVAIENALLKDFGAIILDPTSRKIQVQMMAKEKYVSAVDVNKVQNSFLFFLAFAFLVNALPLNIVEEKQRRIKVGMQIMGLRHCVLWLSWFIVYLVIVVIASSFIIIVMNLINYFERSSIFLFYIILIVAGSSIIAMNMLMTPFIGGVRTMSFVVGLSYFFFIGLYVFLKMSLNLWGYESTAPPFLQYVTCLMSPVAVCVAIDQAIFLDVYKKGFNFDSSLTSGNFPLCASFLMIVFDTFLYLVLMIYFDYTVPGEYGVRYPPLFFLKSSFWSSRETSPETGEMVNFVVRKSQEEDVESVSKEMQKKVGIKIASLTKLFKNKGKMTCAVDDFCLEIFEGHITCLLGHNGAGKTTLINMLTGVIAPTSGSARILGFDITNLKDLEEIRKCCGICPQENNLFDNLSCKEHIKIFAGIKGVPFHFADTLTESILKDVNLELKGDNFVKGLSGGEMRKLSLAIALIGNPKLLFLDEPTSGMDPYSRQCIWTFLKKRKEGKIILLTTHFMDEADILADRKAIMFNGKLRCCGSSLYLKNRFSAGYNLIMTVTPDCASDKVTLLLQSIIPSIRRRHTTGEELAYKIPITEVTQFSDLFDRIDTTAWKLGIKDYGVFLTTLEEVFLKLGPRNKDIVQEEKLLNSANQGSDAENSQQKLLNSANQGSDAENSQQNDSNSKRLSFCSDSGSKLDYFGRRRQISIDSNFLKPFLKGRELTWQRIKAFLKIRILLMMHNYETVIMPLTLAVMFIVMGFAVRGRSKPHPAKIIKPRTFTPFLYILNPNKIEEQAHSSSFLVFDAVNTEDSKAVISQWEKNMAVDNYTAGSLSKLNITSPHHLGIQINELKEKFLTSFVAVYNDSAIHSIPIIINIATQSLLYNMSEQITSSSFPWEKKKISIKNFIPGGIFALFLGSAFVFLIPTFAADAVQDREWRLRGQLRISGVNFNLYWGTFLLSDVILVLIPGILVIGIDIFVQIIGHNWRRVIVAHIILFVTNLPVSVMTGLALSFLFTKTESCLAYLPFILNFMTSVPLILIWTLDTMLNTEAAVLLHYICCVIIPIYNLSGGLFFIERHTQTILAENKTVEDSFKYHKPVLLPILMPVVHIFCMYWLMRVLDIWKVGGSAWEAFPCCTKVIIRASVSCAAVDQNEDEDVKAERERIEDLEQFDGKRPVAYTSQLWKEYMVHTESKHLCGQPEKMPKLAVQNLTIGVNEGEVLGLLGPNGAGKSSVLKMIIAETTPTSGKVVVSGHNIHSNIVSVLQTLGYCPQQDALWEPITLEQHLKFFVAIKGISPDQLDKAVDFFISQLRLEEHRSKASKKLSGGTKRKLSYIMSIVGTPQLLLLDEPSTGMDPKSKRYLWNTISSAFKNTNRGAILTTQSMEEADALCGRVGIMINGKLQCLGSTQHLKSKFGSDYILEVKLATQEEEGDNAMMDAFEEHLTSLFPGIQTVERIMDTAQYTVPKDSVKSLGKTFASLEKCKVTHNLVEYNFSQSTLEQVFLFFAKRQV